MGEKWMKKLFAFTLCLALVFSMASVALAETKTGEVVKTNTAPKMDGKLDSVWNNAKKPDDFSAQYRALWDDEYFYIFVEVTDNVISDLNHQRSGDTYQRDDSVLLHVGEGGENVYLNSFYHAATKKNFGAFTGNPSWKTHEAPVEEYIKHAIEHTAKDIIWKQRLLGNMRALAQ
jgi:hypothetical protein